MGKKYIAYFTGKYRNDYDKDDVSLLLAQRLHFAPKKIALLLNSKEIKVKSHISKDEALLLSRKFYDCGLILSVKEDKKHSENAEQLNDEPSCLSDVFSGSCETKPVSGKYILLLYFNLLMAIAIPLVYLVLIVIAFFGMYFYYVNIIPFANNEIQGVFYQAILRFLPPVIGFFLLIFLLKPLLVKYRKHPRFLLKEHYSPKLFEFVDLLASHIGCQSPSAIYITNEANVSARYAGGIRGFISKEMHLSIGMPVVAGMTLQQLSGCIAHEFGHFAQSKTIRPSYFINSINEWLYTRAYRKDMIDHSIAEYLDANGSMNLTAIFYEFVAMGSSLIRSLFKVLYRLSMRCSHYLSRKFEFDADSYEVEVVGSSSFQGNAVRLRMLNLAKDKIDKIILHTFGKSSVVFEDIPAAVAKVAGKYVFNDDFIRKNMKVSTEVWHAHPADEERINKGKKLNHKGLDIPSMPAKKIFNNFAELNQKISRQYYRQKLSIINPKKYMRPNRKIRI